MSVIINGDTGIDKITDGSVVQADLASGVAGTGPAFSLYKTSTQTIADNTDVKITFDATNFDLTSDADLTNNRVIPSVEGYYQFNATIRILSLGDGDISYLYFHKNGAEVHRGWQYRIGAGGSVNVTCSVLLYMNGSTDYMEIYTRHDFGSSRSAGAGSGQTTLSGFLARAV